MLYPVSFRAGPGSELNSKKPYLFSFQYPDAFFLVRIDDNVIFLVSMNYSSLINKIKNSSLAKDSFWAIFGNIIGKGLALISGILIARFLGKELYGEYGIIKNTLAFLAIISTFGFGYTATKYVAEYKESRNPNIGWLVRRIEQLTLVISFILTIALFLGADKVAEFIKAPDLAMIFRKYGVVLLFNAITSTQIGILSGMKLFKINAKVNCYSGISLLMFSVSLTFFFGLDGAILSLLGSYIVQFLFNEKYIRENIEESKENDANKNFWLMLSFSFPIALQESLYVVVNWLTLYLLVEYADFGEVGLSSAATTWSAIVVFVPGMLKNVMFSYLTTSNNHELLVNRLLLLNFLSTAVPVIFLIAFSKFICSLYGPSFTGLLPVLILSLISSVFISISEVYCYEFISRGKPWIVFLSRLVRDAFILIAGWMVLPIVTGRHAMFLAIVGIVANMAFFTILAVVYKYKRQYAR